MQTARGVSKRSKSAAARSANARNAAVASARAGYPRSVLNSLASGNFRTGPPASLRGSTQEVKCLDTTISTASPGGAALAFNATGSIICVNEIRVGSGFNNRVGNKIEMKSVDVMINPGVLTVTRAAQEDLLRIALVYDRQVSNNNLPAISDVFQDTDQAGTNTTGAWSGINLGNRDRFTILADKRIMLPGATATAGVLTNIWPNSFGGAGDGSVGLGCIREFRNLNKLLANYKAASSPAVIGDISTGAIYLITFSTNTAGQEIWCAADWSVRLRYYD